MHMIGCWAKITHRPQPVHHAICRDIAATEARSLTIQVNESLGPIVLQYPWSWTCLLYTSKIVVARQKEGDSVDCFAALSSVCPHLGCAVHWEQQNKRFFCPCHNGAFDASGKATEGPPAAASQSLKEYPLKVENGLLFIAVPSDGIA